MTVIGVAAVGFPWRGFGEPAALWIPAMMAREATLEFNRVLNRRAVWMHVFARLKPGVTPEEAKTGLQPWFKSMLETDTRREDFRGRPQSSVESFSHRRLTCCPAPRAGRACAAALARPLWVLMVGRCCCSCSHP